MRIKGENGTWLVLTSWGRRRFVESQGCCWAFDDSLNLQPRDRSDFESVFYFVQLARASFVATARRQEQWPSGIKFLCVHCDASSIMAADDVQEAVVPVRGFLRTTQSKMCKWEMWHGASEGGVSASDGDVRLGEGQRPRQCSDSRATSGRGPRQLRPYARTGRSAGARLLFLYFRLLAGDMSLPLLLGMNWSDSSNHSDFCGAMYLLYSANPVCSNLCYSLTIYHVSRRNTGF